jgi:hypothetical protein
VLRVGCVGRDCDLAAPQLTDQRVERARRTAALLAQP